VGLLVYQQEKYAPIIAQKQEPRLMLFCGDRLEGPCERAVRPQSTPTCAQTVAA
jgi:hypothetical protein